jgi:hypothetical protein
MSTEAVKRRLREGGLGLERGRDGRLVARRGGRRTPVSVVRCFPWTDPERYLSLRDEEDEEVALVRDARELDPGSREALVQALADAGFVFEVEAVLAVDEEIEIRVFRVRTRQGARRFQTLRDEWPRALPDGSLLFRDVGGDLYRTPPAEALDARSRKALFAFLD